MTPKNNDAPSPGQIGADRKDTRVLNLIKIKTRAWFGGKDFIVKVPIEAIENHLENQGQAITSGNILAVYEEIMDNLHITMQNFDQGAE